MIGRTLLAVAAVAAFASCASAGIVVSQAPDELALNAMGYTSAVPAEPTTMLRVSLTLQRQAMDRMEIIANAVSDPSSPHYTKYLTVDEIAQITRPSVETTEAVKAWLDAADVPYTLNGARVTMDLTVAQASALFGTTFTTVRNPTTAQTATIGAAVVLPEAVHEHIEAVFGVHGLPLPPRKNVGAGTPYDVTPSVIESAYSVAGVNVSRTDKVRQAVAEFQGQLLSQADLTTFFTKYVKSAKTGDNMVYAYVGDKTQGEGVEANLDIQYIMGVAPGIKTEAWQYSGQDFCTDLSTWTQGILAKQDTPVVFSVSYGWQGDMSQIGCSTSQIQSIDNDFKTITAKGVSIIFASGDSGSGYSSFFGFDAKLYASWPASSVWVTAVGSTRFINQTPGSGRQATDQFGSGGGFSRIVNPAPAWQSAAIKTFYSEETNAPKNHSVYGFGGRGTPDVAALGEGFQVIMNGSPQSVGGTSAAAPTFSALVSLVNEARSQAGKKPMGNLNQFLYSKGNTILTDVTVGNDRISRQGSTVPLGFDCEKGWDPVTGWGEVNFPAFLKAAMAA